MKRFRCAREFIEQYLTNNLNNLIFEMFATGRWENEYPDEERYQIYKEYLNKLSQLGKRGKNKIFNVDNLCMRLSERDSKDGVVFDLALYDYETKDIKLIFIFFNKYIKIVNLKTSLPFEEKDFQSWDDVKELFVG